MIIGLLSASLSFFYLVFAIFFDSSIKGTSGKSNIQLQNKENEQYQFVNSRHQSTKVINTKTEHSRSTRKSLQGIQQKPLEYRAKQVLIRAENNNDKRKLPIGSNIIGKLLSSIDSRDLMSQIKVLLPYGAKFNGEQLIPKNSMLIGKANYTGNGERIFISFDRLVTPSGDETKIMANALDSSDYANGIIGDVHSESGIRIAGTLGLTMISTMADVLTEKYSHGDLGVVTPKSTIKNSVYQGVSKVTEMEATRQAEEMAKVTPFIILNAGKELIISLTSSFIGEGY